jgi:PAS domain S-box-containing protein
MQLISKKIKTPIRLVKTNNWEESLDKIRLRECDILSLTEETPLRKKYLDFTPSYIESPLVIATKVGIPFIDNLNNIKNKSIGFVKHYSIEEFLKDKNLNINLVEVDSIQEGLLLVDRDKLFGFLDNSMAINNEIQKKSMTNIGIKGQFSNFFKLKIASRNDEQILNKILEKALFSIDNKTRDSIIQRWNNINYQVQTDYQLIFQTLFFAVVLISIFIYWNLKLKDVIKNKEIIQKKLEYSELKFRTLFNEAPILMDAFDKNGKVILWNKECEKVFGWSLAELEEIKDPIKLFYPDSLVQENILKAYSENDITYKEWHPMTKDGRKIITKWANIKLENNEVINIGYDVTQERNNENSIKEKTEQLKFAKKELEELNNSLEEKIQDEIIKNTKQQMVLMHQSKLVQMGEMIENIAHQWRQPLAQINSLVLLIDATLEKNKFTNSTVESKLNEIESMTEYMSKTIDDFKNFFNPNKEMNTFLIETSIKKAYEIVNGLIAFHYIDVNINVEKELQCYSYSEELQQVILIILNNSIEALLLKEIAFPQIFINAYSVEDFIFINIEDNGLGIKIDYLEKIFEPYFTTKSKSQGTGLGLYMAKMIIENGLAGQLSVENKSNGASFTIKIPKGKK